MSSATYVEVPRKVPGSFHRVPKFGHLWEQPPTKGGVKSSGKKGWEGKNETRSWSACFRCLLAGGWGDFFKVHFPVSSQGTPPATNLVDRPLQSLCIGWRRGQSVLDKASSPTSPTSPTAPTVPAEVQNRRNVKEKRMR